MTSRIFPVLLLTTPFILSVLTDRASCSTHVWIVVGQPSDTPRLGSVFTTKLGLSAWNGVPGALDMTVDYDPLRLKIESIQVPENSPLLPDLLVDSSKTSLGRIRFVSFHCDSMARWDTLNTIATVAWFLLNMGDSTFEILPTVADLLESRWSAVEVHTFAQNIDLRTTSGPSSQPIPTEYELKNNYPNPFNLSTTISYQIPEKAIVSMKVYSIAGQLVSILVNEEQPRGTYTIRWNGLNDRGNAVASGVYFLEMRANAFRKTLTMILLR